MFGFWFLFAFSELIVHNCWHSAVFVCLTILLVCILRARVQPTLDPYAEAFL